MHLSCAIAVAMRIFGRLQKKYSTSVTAILEENDLTDDKLSDCGMLLIPLTN